MSWIENLESPLVIKTGDGKEYQPFWKNAKKRLEFNFTSFEFPNVDGSLVDRKRPKGEVYQVEFYFQGADHLEEAKAFATSAKDPRYWTLQHPYYGELKVHPTKLLFDNDRYNVSKITGEVLETIVDVFPKGEVNAEDKISDDKAALDEQGSQNYANDVPEPDSGDVGLMSDTVDQAEKRTLRNITNDLSASEFRNAVSEANRKITNAIGAPLAAIRAIDTVMNFPAQIQNNIQTRVNQLSDALTDLIGKIGNDPSTVPASQKRFHEKVLTSTLTSMALSVVGGGGFGSRGAALRTATQIIDNYNTMVSTLDDMSTGDGGTLGGYVPNQTTLLQTQDIIFFTVKNLLAITVTSKQEHSYILDRDDDVINLTHRFYGLDSNDENLELFIETNEIGVNELLELKQGRQVVFYV